MGTSQSSKGQSAAMPLVPPWADDQPNQPLPDPIPGRFRQFRRSMTEYMKSGDRNDLQSALGHYARTSTGGASIAVRKFGNIIKAGGSLFDLLSTGQTQLNGQILDISQLSDKPLEEAIAIIADALTPINGDGERIRMAINNALIEALDGVTEFDITTVNDIILESVLINYLSESITLEVLLNIGDSMNNAESASKQMDIENNLHELTKVIVEKNMSKKLQNKIKSFSAQQIIDFQRQTIYEVWQEWESYQ